MKHNIRKIPTTQASLPMNMTLKLFVSKQIWYFSISLF